MSAIFGKEFKNSMRTMTGPIFIAFLLMWFGVSVGRINLEYGVSQFEYTIASAAFLSLLALPLLTMRSFAEERRSGSDKLLYSLPVKTGSIVLAKYFASLAVFAIPVAVVALYPLALAKYGTVYLNTAYSSLIAYFFLGATLIAIGLFISSLTESQVISAIVSLGVIILLFYMSSLAADLPQTKLFSLIFLFVLAAIAALITYLMTKSAIAASVVASLGAVATVVFYIVKPGAFEGLATKWLSALAVFNRMNAFFYGRLDVAALIFYVSVSVLFLFLTALAVEKRRWN